MSSSKIQEYNLDPNMGLAKEETAQEILGKLNDGVAGVTAQTKAFTEVAGGVVSGGESISVTGKGKVSLMVTSDNQMKITVSKITIDGITFTLRDSYLAPPFTLYFEKSIKIELGSSSNSAYYIIQT